MDAVAANCRSIMVWLDSALADGRLGQDPTEAILPDSAAEGHSRRAMERGGTSHSGKPFQVLRDLLSQERGCRTGGVGATGYDLARHIESLPTTHEMIPASDCCLCFYDQFREIDPLLILPRSQDGEKGIVDPNLVGLSSTFSQESYFRAVQRSKQYISAGDIYQVNLSQRFRFPLRQEPFALYQRLRDINPAPFAAYLNFPQAQVLSASPERFLLFDPDSRFVQTRPIRAHVLVA
jgi:anthranilate/para-aminobenzoate synthase component I